MSCTAPLALNRTGRVVRNGNLSIDVAGGANLATSALDIIEAGEEIVERLAVTPRMCDLGGVQVECISAADLDPLLLATVSAALFTPFAPYTALGVRYGLLDGLDVGLRFAPSTMRFEVGYQLFGPRDEASGWAGTIRLAWNRHSPPVPSFLEKVNLDDFGRDDIDVPLVLGYRFGEMAQLTLGLRYMRSSWRMDVVPEVPILLSEGDVEEIVEGLVPDTDFAGSIDQLGAVVGFWVGWKYVYVGAELAVTRYSTSVRILGTDHSIEGVSVFPTVSAIAEF